MKIQPAKFKTNAPNRDDWFGEPLTVRLQTAPLRVTGPRSAFDIAPATATKARSNRSIGRLAAKRSEGGMVTVIFIALLAIMLVVVMVETSSLIRLRREVKLLEQQQIKRLNTPQTNVVPAVTKPPNN